MFERDPIGEPTTIRAVSEDMNERAMSSMPDGTVAENNVILGFLPFLVVFSPFSCFRFQ